MVQTVSTWKSDKRKIRTKCAFHLAKALCQPSENVHKSCQHSRSSELHLCFNAHTCTAPRKSTHGEKIHGPVVMEFSTNPRVWRVVVSTVLRHLSCSEFLQAPVNRHFPPFLPNWEDREPGQSSRLPEEGEREQQTQGSTTSNQSW